MELKLELKWSFFCLLFIPFVFVVARTHSYQFLQLTVFGCLHYCSACLYCWTSKIIKPNPYRITENVLEGKFYYVKIIFGVSLWNSPTPTRFGILKNDFDYFHFGPQKICHTKFRGFSFNSIGVNRIQTNRQTNRQTDRQTLGIK